jgi:hypothetical protein
MIEARFLPAAHFPSEFIWDDPRGYFQIGKGKQLIPNVLVR